MGHLIRWRRAILTEKKDEASQELFEIWDAGIKNNLLQYGLRWLWWLIPLNLIIAITLM